MNVHESEDPELSLGYIVRDTDNLMTKALRTRLHPYGLTPGQWFVLRMLSLEEGVSQRELSRRVGTTEPSTVAALRLLERDGMIRRVRNAADRRTINVFLTDEARSLLATVHHCHLEVNAVAGGDIGADELSGLRSTLRKIRDNLSRDVEAQR
ncbi:MAG: MarR family winged helix-turn-helix transcriptional regulator [Rhodospirillales bacterium]